MTGKSRLTQWSVLAAVKQGKVISYISVGKNGEAHECRIYPFSSDKGLKGIEDMGVVGDSHPHLTPEKNP